ncbi:MAG TPA: helix-turn-helix domain-containing protein [Kaistia sp.]|nr:helix-turn-helix domain-containing protein [Kaistia sp.]
MSTLPPPTKEVIRLVQMMGAEGALALIEWQAPARYYVPKSVGPDDPLAKAVGLDAARALVEARGGEAIMVPVAREWRILIYRSRGMSYAEIGRRLQCSQTTIWRRLSQHELTAAQLDLFPT